MFDIGFPELILVSIVALLVIGPDKLPGTVRTMMLWIGRIKNGFSNVKKELEQEIGADEIRQQLHNESIMKELAKTRSQIDEAIESADNELNGIKQETQRVTSITPELTSQTAPKESPSSGKS